jgi:hypothetical protein
MKLVLIVCIVGNYILSALRTKSIEYFVLGTWK